MFQRLGRQAPSPLKPNPNEATIFSKDGKLREQYHKLCQEINITPEELCPRTLESFHEPNVPQNVQILRYNNYENKRRAKLEALKALAKQRNIIPVAKPTRPGTTTPRTRQISFTNTESMSAAEKELSHVTRPPTRDFNTTLAKFPTGHKTSTENPSYQSGNQGNKASEAKGTWTANMRRSVSNMEMEQEGNVTVDEIEQKFRKYLTYKTVEKERLMNASMVVTRKDEEHREELKKAYEDKLEKWNKKKHALTKQKKQNDDDEEYRKEKIERQREMQKENQKALHEKVLAKLEKSEKQKRAEIEKRVTKVAQLNSKFQERYSSCMEKKKQNIPYI